MNNQLKYKVTYGFDPQHKEVEVYAFTLLEAIQIARKVNQDVSRTTVVKVEQFKEI